MSLPVRASIDLACYLHLGLCLQPSSRSCDSVDSSAYEHLSKPANKEFKRYTPKIEDIFHFNISLPLSSTYQTRSQKPECPGFCAHAQSMNGISISWKKIKSSQVYLLLFILIVVPFLISSVDHHPPICTHLPWSSSPPGTSSPSLTLYTYTKVLFTSVNI